MGVAAWLRSRNRFWGTVCKTVRPMLSDRCLSVCPVCLSVTLAYCGQTVECIKIKTLHARRPRPWPHCSMGTQLPRVVARRLDGLRCHLARRSRPRPRRHCVRWGPRSLPPKGGTAVTAPNIGPCIVAKHLHGSRCHLTRGRPWPRPHCITWGPNSPLKSAQHPHFYIYCGDGRPSELLLSFYCTAHGKCRRAHWHIGKYD